VIHARIPAALLLLSACDALSEGPLTCTLADCGGGTALIRLVDEGDRPVAARGEYRILGTGGSMQLPIAFNCTGENGEGETDAADAGRYYDTCSGSFLAVWGAADPRRRVEVRFELALGGLTEWLPVSLNYVSHTDPDFNGPGCPCTWYEAQPRDLVVPDAARRP